MSELIEAIHRLGVDKKIRQADLKIIRENKAEASKYFHDCLDRMAEDIASLDETLANDAFFGICFLAEWKDKSAFKKVQRVLHEIGEDVDDLWLGDALTENLPAIMYQLYDGDLKNLKTAFYDLDIQAFARMTFMDIMFQFFIDGKIDRLQLDDFFIQLEEMSDDELDYELISYLCLNMAQIHDFDYLPKTKKWFERGLIDEYVAGDYSDYVDITFEYPINKADKNFVRTEFCFEDELGRWYKFEGSSHKTLNQKISDTDRKKLFEKAIEQYSNPYKNVGRNDPCPCGSGKKFKKCHLNKLEYLSSSNNGIETNAEREKWLKHYPQISFDPNTNEDVQDFMQEAGRLYLEDLYDRDAIAIDYNVYLALKRRPRRSFLGGASEIKEDQKKISEAYLEHARELYEKKIMSEGIKSPEEFDKKYAIHYTVEEWLK